MNLIHCLISTGRPITATVSEFLYRKACEMIRDKKSRIHLKGSVCSGKLSTEGKHAMMGALGGMEFKAEIEFEHGETVVTFIVRTVDVDDPDAEWGDLSSADIEKAAVLEAMQEAPPTDRLN